MADMDIALRKKEIVDGLVKNFLEDCDRDEGGVLERNEAKSFFDLLRELYGITEKACDEEYDDFLKDLDSDGSGIIKKSEIRAYLKKVEYAHGDMNNS